MTALEKSLVNVHDTIINALEEDIYREYIGKFHVEHAAGKFEDRPTEERRIQLADKIEEYILHLKLGDEEIPGTNEKLGHISFEYRKRRPRPEHHYEDHCFEIRAGFPYKSDNEKFFSSNEFTCWEYHFTTGVRFPKKLADFPMGHGEARNLRMTTTKSVWKGPYRMDDVTEVIREFTATDKTLDWIYDQLMTYRNPSAEEKAKQLARLLSCGDNLEGKFHYAELGGAERNELPDIAVPHEGEWRIERIDRPHRGRLFILTASKVAPEYTLVVSYSSVDNVFDGHEFRPGEEKQPKTFSKTENPHLLDKALDAIARRIGHNWK